MERLMEGFSMLTWREYLFAAAVAYVITYIYRVFSRMLKNSRERHTLSRPLTDRRSIAARNCSLLMFFLSRAENSKGVCRSK